MEEDAETLKHKSAIDASTSSAKIRLKQFFKNTISSKDQLKTVAKEGTWVYHTARHNISFKSNDCSGTLVKTMSGFSQLMFIKNWVDVAEQKIKLMRKVELGYNLTKTMFFSSHDAPTSTLKWDE